MKDMSQSLTSNGFLNSGFGLAGMASAAKTTPQDRIKANRIRTLPVHLMLEMHESNRLEIPFWITLALSACVALALSF